MMLVMMMMFLLISYEAQNTRSYTVEFGFSSRISFFMVLFNMT